MRMYQLVMASIVLLALSASIASAGDGTALTYQGRLLDAGEPANGMFDLEFGLWDAVNKGNPVGVPQVLDDVPVTDGLFTVLLDFGADAFDSTSRWLEISVDGVPLLPRQPITRSPYSIQTRGIFVDQNERVGIATVAPDRRLHVVGLGGVGANGVRITHGNNLSNWDLLVGGPNNSFPAGFAIAQDGEARLVVQSSTGNVGIGTTTPPNKFSVFGDADFAGNVGIGTTTPLNKLSVVGDVDFTGNVGIGTTTPDALLHVGNFSSVPNYALVSSSGGGSGRAGLKLRHFNTNFGWTIESSENSESYGLNFIRHFDNPEGFSSLFIRQFGGEVGIGTTDPQSQLHVVHPVVGGGWGVRIHNGVSGFQGGMRLDDNGFFDVTNNALNGNPNFARLDSNGNWTAISDGRMKEDIAPLDGVLERAMALEPVTFRYINQDRVQAPDKQIGFIGQEVEPLFPSLVTRGDDVLTMNYSGLGVVAVAAVQELKREKDAEIAALRADVADLRKLMSELITQKQDSQ